MLNYNPSIVVENIKKLMEQGKISQLQLAQEINSNQATVSKYLNQKQNLSFEFIYTVAQYFNVTIDKLCVDKAIVTNASLPEPEPKIDVYEVCNALAILFKSKYIYTQEIVYKEDVCYEQTDDYNRPVGMYYPKYDIENKYTSILFPNYTEIERSFKSDDDHEEYMDLLRDYGNDNDKNRLVNIFLRQLVDLLSIYRKGSMDSETYLRAIDANLTKQKGCSSPSLG